VEVRRLEDRPDPSDRVLEVAVPAAEDERLAGVRLGQSQEQPERRRLARAVRAEEAGHRSSREREGHPVDRGDVSVPLRQSAAADHLLARRGRCELVHADRLASRLRPHPPSIFAEASGARVGRAEYSGYSRGSM
jgi:hypothetical protein